MVRLLIRLVTILPIAIAVLCPAAYSQGYPPEEAAERMTVADGFEVTLSAAEPLVRQPVAIDLMDRDELRTSFSKQQAVK